MLPCHCKGMEENNSPYIYEKPLRPRGSKSVRAIAAVGLFAIGTTVGGSAFGAALGINQAAETETADAANANLVVVDPVETKVDTDSFGNVAAATVDPVPAEPIIQVPLQQAKPKPSERALSLPVLPEQNFSNLSSATPSAGSSGQGGGSYTYGEREARAGHDEDEDDDRYESDHRGDGDDDHEDGDDD
ncbi:MAG: hypothetical protein RLY13_841 [Actinomycetota bacterium]